MTSSQKEKELNLMDPFSITVYREVTSKEGKKNYIISFSLSLENTDDSTKLLLFQ